MNTEPIKTCPKCQAPIPAEAPQGLCPKCLLATASVPTEGGQSAEASPPPSLESIASAFPQLEILEFIGQGGMGMVFKARQPKLDRFVALKLLPQKPAADPAFQERFNREARVLARLSHPNIVAVHDFGQAGPFFYLLMEFVDGVNLRQAMRAGRFTPAQALALVPKICDALQYAHEEGVLHRDVKPENLLLDTRGRVKIADFGIAKLLGDTAKDVTLTASGQSIGTPHYMAPEQFEHPQDVDQRADIYSLGVVFYEMLTGELPLGRFAPPSEKSAVDERVDEIVMRTLEKERGRRFQSAGEVKTRVEHVTANPAASGSLAGPGETQPIPSLQKGSRPWSRRAIAAAMLVALSLFEWFLVVVSHGHIRAGGVLLLFLFMGVPAIVGTFLGVKTTIEIRAARGRERGVLFALFAAGAWPFLLVNGVLFASLMCFAWILEREILHLRGPGLSVFAAIVGVFSLLTANAILIRNLKTRWRGDGPLLPISSVRDWVKRAPRSMLWLLSCAVLILCLILSVGFRTFRRMDEPARNQRVSGPNPPPGYEVSEGETPANNNRQFRTTVLVPAGYVLTITPTWSSNQVVLRSSDPNLAAYLIAPTGLGVLGNLSWRLLGNATLADGAPLEFALGPNQDFETIHKSFHLVPPEAITVDWVSAPAQVWPPQNGHTKYLIVKGLSSESNQEGQPAVEWSVGIETRLDPIPPANLAVLKHPVAGLGTNWLSTFENNPSTPTDDSNPESTSESQ